MKKVLICGIMAIVSSMWAIASYVNINMNLVSEWNGSRFWESAADCNAVFPLVISLLVLAASVVMLCVEYFKEK